MKKSICCHCGRVFVADAIICPKCYQNGHIGDGPNNCSRCREEFENNICHNRFTQYLSMVEGLFDATIREYKYRWKWNV